MSVDLTNVKPGDRALTRGGKTLTFVEHTSIPEYPFRWQTDNYASVTTDRFGSYYGDVGSSPLDITELVVQDLYLLWCDGSVTTWLSEDEALAHAEDGDKVFKLVGTAEVKISRKLIK